MFMVQIIGCIVAALVVAVLWLGVELRGIKRDADRRGEIDRMLEKAGDAEFEASKARGELYAAVDMYRSMLNEMRDGRDDSQARS